MTKLCRKCNHNKPFSDFGKDIHRKNGITTACKSCRNPQSKAWRDKNKEYVKEINVRSKAKRKEYYDSPERKIKYRSLDLERRFGLTHEDYLRMLELQGGVCAICGKVRLNKGKYHMAIDHCHKSGKVRGILCGWCNKGLGLFDDKPEFLNKAIEYLAKERV